MGSRIRGKEYAEVREEFRLVAKVVELGVAASRGEEVGFGEWCWCFCGVIGRIRGGGDFVLPRDNLSE